jgi:hypothetical protein
MHDSWFLVQYSDQFASWLKLLGIIIPVWMVQYVICGLHYVVNAYVCSM